MSRGRITFSCSTLLGSSSPAMSAHRTLGLRTRRSLHAVTIIIGQMPLKPVCRSAQPQRGRPWPPSQTQGSTPHESIGKLWIWAIVGAANGRLHTTEDPRLHGRGAVLLVAPAVHLGGGVPLPGAAGAPASAACNDTGLLAGGVCMHLALLPTVACNNILAPDAPFR